MEGLEPSEGRSLLREGWSLLEGVELTRRGVELARRGVGPAGRVPYKHKDKVSYKHSWERSIASWSQAGEVSLAPMMSSNSEGSGAPPYSARLLLAPSLPTNTRRLSLP